MNETYPPGWLELRCSCGAVAHASEALAGVLTREADDHRALGHRVSLTVIEGNDDAPSPAQAR